MPPADAVGVITVSSLDVWRASIQSNNDPERQKAKRYSRRKYINYKNVIPTGYNGMTKNEILPGDTATPVMENIHRFMGI